MNLMREFRPDIVFHAAALKHVPILERDWSEGVKTNIFGSVNVADAAVASGAQAMVMISTDKAIEPVSVLGATKRLGIVDRVTPAGATRDRRSTWPSREAAKAHFGSRPLFRHFSGECLEDYVDYGLVECDGALHLRIDPAIEYQIYRTIPHDMMRHLPKLRVPAVFIGGAESDVVRRVRLAGMKPKFTMRKVPGGHLFPFERPQDAAMSIVQALEAIEAAPRAS